MPVTCYWTCMSMDSELISLFLSGVVPCQRLGPDLACFPTILAFFLDCHLGFYFGAGLIFFKDLEVETIHVCIAWALLNICLGGYCDLHLLVYAHFVSGHVSFLVVYRFWGLVTTRYSLLPCHRLWLGWFLRAELCLF